MMIFQFGVVPTMFRCCEFSGDRYPMPVVFNFVSSSFSLPTHIILGVFISIQRHGDRPGFTFIQNNFFEYDIQNEFHFNQRLCSTILTFQTLAPNLSRHTKYFYSSRYIYPLYSNRKSEFPWTQLVSTFSSIHSRNGGGRTSLELNLQTSEFPFGLSRSFISRHDTCHISQHEAENRFGQM